MNSRYLIDGTVRRLSRTATFVFAAAAILEPSPLPEGSSTVSVPLFSPAPNRTFVVRPPIAEDAAPAELLPEGVQLVVRPNYPPSRHAITTKAPWIPTEDEVFPWVRSITTGKAPPSLHVITTKAPWIPTEDEVFPWVRSITPGKAPQSRHVITARSPQIEEVPVLEADELTDHRRVSIGYTQPYPLRTRTVLPQLSDETAADLPEGSSHSSIPLFGPRPQQNIFRQAILTEDVQPESPPEGVQRIVRYQQPYNPRQSFVVKPHTEEHVPAADQALVIVTEFENRSRFWISGVPPEELVVVEAPELANSRRSITLGKSPYLGKSVTVSRQPTEIDELIQQRRSITLGPPTKYAGQTRTVTPQLADAEIVEYDERIASRIVVMRGPGAKPGKTVVVTRQPTEIDELLQSRRAAYWPGQPYRGKSFVYVQKPEETDELLGSRRSVVVPTETRVKGYASAGYLTVEADELLQRRVSIYLPQPYRRHFWKTGNAIQFDDNVYPSLPDLVRTSTEIDDLPHTTAAVTLPHTTRITTLPHTTKKALED